MIDQSVRIDNNPNVMPDNSPCYRCHVAKWRHEATNRMGACAKFVSR